MNHTKEIYRNIIEDTPYMDNAAKAVDHEINERLKNIGGNGLPQDYETFRDIIYQVVATAEEEAFIVGFRYAIAIILDDICQSKAL